MPRNPDKKQTRRKPAAPAAPRPAYEPLFARETFSKREWLLVAAVFAVALVPRLVFFFINKNNNPLFYHPMLDALFHHEWAREIVSGDFWGDEVFFRAPLYPYVLALLYKVSGSSIAFAVLFQHLLGAVSTAMVYLLARRFFAPRVALLAGLFAALYWPLIYFEGDLLFETLFVFLSLAFLLVFAVAAERRTPALLFAAGLLLGLGAVTRPLILVLVPLLPVIFHFSAKTRPASGAARRAWMAPTILVIAGSLVFIMPVMVRNYLVGRDFVPIASQGGVNFYIGNNPHSNGTQAMVPGARADLHGTYQGAIELAERDAGRSLKPSEVSNYYTKKALDFIILSPGEAARLTLKKLYLFWAGVERSNDKYMQFFWERFGLGRLPFPGFWLIGPLALLGGFLLAPRWRRFSLLYLFVLSYMASVVVFFVNGRFRLPVTPVLAIFASYAVFHAYTALRSKSRDLYRVVAVLLLAVVFVNYDYVSFRGVRSLDESVSYWELGKASLKMGDKEAALSYFQQAHDMQQRYPMRGYGQIAGDVDFNLGVLYWENELHSRAIEALERIPDNDPRAYQAKALLADAYVKKGRHEDAIAIYTRLLQANPRDPRSRFGLGVALRLTGDLERAREAFEQVLRENAPPDGSVNLELARTLDRLGDAQGALRNYEIAAAHSAQRRDATLEMARLYARTGRKDKAIGLMEELTKAYPDDRMIEMEARSLRAGD